MNISTFVVLKIVDADTLKELDEVSGPATSIILPRVGEYVELTLFDGVVGGMCSSLFKVMHIGHKFSDAYKNVTTLYVKSHGPMESM